MRYEIDVDNKAQAIKCKKNRMPPAVNRLYLDTTRQFAIHRGNCSFKKQRLGNLMCP